MVIPKIRLAIFENLLNHNFGYAFTSHIFIVEFFTHKAITAVFQF